tara:strand:- start:2895 stop:4022 length:1128 start_codon:yes stop_codon:yes gene_type:complete
MSNYSTFFPTSSGGGGSSSGSLPYSNRRIFTSEAGGSCTWPVPSGTTSVEVHVWGGGGAATGAPDDGATRGGGGGGGYARAEYAVTDSDTLSITIGGPGGTSSVTIPTQSPGSPISATGGSNSTSSSGASGGSGSVSLASPHPTQYCFTANGGTGGDGSPTISCNQCAWCANLTRVWIAGRGGGGAAGSPHGNGGNGGNNPTTSCGGFSSGGGGGIGCNANNAIGGGTRCYGTAGKTSNYNTNCSGEMNAAQRADCHEDVWWKVEDIGGAGGMGFCCIGQCNQNLQVMKGGNGAGGGGGGFTTGTSPCVQNWYLSQGAQGGFLGGGGGGVWLCSCTPSGTSCCLIKNTPTQGRGGIAGGAGGGAAGSPGAVIIYW